MIRVLLLPDNIYVEIRREKIKIREIMEQLGESNPEYVTILVNDSLAKDLDMEVTSLDRVVMIKQPTGG